jgi:hypothetical protein
MFTPGDDRTAPGGSFLRGLQAHVLAQGSPPEPTMAGAAEGNHAQN